MKVSYPRTIVIHEDGKKPIRFTDAAKAAEYWARAKEEEWIAKNKDNKKWLVPGRYSGRYGTSNALYDEARVRYRKMKRRAQAIFRRIINETQD